MTKQEFLQDLQRALAGKMDSAKVQELAAYYSEYFETEIRKGKTQEEVAALLGSPRLLAKSILEASERQSQEETDGNKEEKKRTSGMGERMAGVDQRRARVVLIVILVFLILVAVIGVLTSLIWTFLPVLLPGAIILYFIHWYRKQ